MELCVRKYVYVLESLPQQLPTLFRKLYEKDLCLESKLDVNQNVFVLGKRKLLLSIFLLFII